MRSMKGAGELQAQGMMNRDEMQQKGEKEGKKCDLQAFIGSRK